MVGLFIDALGANSRVNNNKATRLRYAHSMAKRTRWYLVVVLLVVQIAMVNRRECAFIAFQLIKKGRIYGLSLYGGKDGYHQDHQSYVASTLSLVSRHFTHTPQTCWLVSCLLRKASET